VAKSDQLQKLNEAAQFIRSKTALKPQVGLVLGSGLGSFVEKMQVEVSLPFHEIPHFGSVSVEGHRGQLIFGTVSGVPVIAQQGRLHYYEGHSIDSVIFPVRLMGHLGVETLILTNSAGGLGDGMRPGDFMVIEDHINLTGNNPLIGANIKELGPRFPDMSEAYDRQLLGKMAQVFQKMNIALHKGVYAGVLGPSYETPAEVRFLKQIGCSAVGMSTVFETIAANHMGMKVAGLSCITNLAAGLSSQKLNHQEVTDTAKRVEMTFGQALSNFVSEI